MYEINLFTLLYIRVYNTYKPRPRDSFARQNCGNVSVVQADDRNRVRCRHSAKPHYYSMYKPGLRCFEDLGETENRGGGLFIREFDVSAILVNLHISRHICWHNLILKTCCYISDNIKISNVYIHRRFQFLAEVSRGPLHKEAWGHGHCGTPPLNPSLSIWISESSLKRFVTTYWLLSFSSYFSFYCSLSISHLNAICLSVPFRRHKVWWGTVV
jgi:hypothetical protein